MKKLSGRIKSLIAWWNSTRPGRAVRHYFDEGGKVLAGGIAYSALFSIFAALTIGYTAFTSLLGKNDTLRVAVADVVNNWLPGLVSDDADTTGLITTDSLKEAADASPTGLVTGIVAAVVLLFSALAFMTAMKAALRAMLGVEVTGENVVLGKVREIATFLGLGIAVLLSAILGLLVNGALGWLLSLFGINADAEGSWLVQAAGFAVVWVVDTCVVIMMFTLLAGAKPPWRDLLIGAGGAGIAIGLVRLAGSAIVGHEQSNALLAQFTVMVTLLVWVNLMARIVLLAASWTADPIPARDLGDREQPAVPERAKQAMNWIKAKRPGAGRG